MNAFSRSFLQVAAALLVATAGRVEAQQIGETLDATSTHELITIGSTSDDLLRAAQLQGAPADGYLLRSVSSLARVGEGADLLDWAVLTPRVETSWNSEIPYSLNEGYGWSGRGWNSRVEAGAAIQVGPLRLIAAPEVVYSENADFEIVPNELPNRSDYALWWFADTMSIDMPVRFGEEERQVVEPGQSSISLIAGPVSAGFGTENQWWGPGLRNAIVLSNHAPGFAHAFLRTERPLRTPVGRFEGVWLAGELEGSDFFYSAPGDSVRSLSGFAMTFSPSAAPGLYLGLARTVYATYEEDRGWFAPAADVFTDWSGADELTRNQRERPSEQLISLFARWLLPENGVELYGEWARYRLPMSVSDFIEQPTHTQGYTLGMQWLHPVTEAMNLRLQGEFTNLERSSSYRRRPIGSYYTSLDLPHGYTNQGKVLGAAIGPGSSSQWIAGDVVSSGYRLGIFGSRIRWNNDAYFRRTSPWPFFGHDVTLLGGIRGGFDWNHIRLDAEVTHAKRHNFLFQNWGAGWGEMARGVDVSNQTFRLQITPLIGR